MAEDLSLILKYRPDSFNDFYGNESVVESLRSILNRESGIPKCIIFEGPSGCGKTTLARIVAEELGCSDNDYREYNMSNTRGIDTAREIISKCSLAPLGGKVKVYVLDEIHMATKDFLNSMLKTLEEPPKHVYFILCTTEPEQIDSKLKTIRGQRATVFKINPLNKRDMTKFLKDILKKEGVEFPDKHIDEICNASDGSPRKALNILDQIIDIDDDDKAFNAIVDSTVSETTIKELAQYLLSKDKKEEKKVREMIKGISSSSGGTVEDVRMQLAGYMNVVYLNSGNKNALNVIEALSEPTYYRGWFHFTLAIITACGF